MYNGAPALGQTPALDLVVGARRAADWIKGAIRKFLNLEQTLALEMHQAAQLEGAARAAGRLQQAEDAKRVREAAFALLLDYDAVKTRLEDLLARIPGLGVIPVLVLIASGAAIIALAGAMAAIFRRESAQEKALDLVAAGVITPQEAEKFANDRRSTLFSGIGPTAGIGSLVALVVAMAVGLPLLIDVVAPPRRA